MEAASENWLATRLSLERSLYKALHEFQRLRAVRQGRPVPFPAALDVDVSISAPE